MLGKNPSVKQTKEAIDKETAIKAYRVPRLVKEGFLPETALHLENTGCDMRSSYPWVIAFYELKSLSAYKTLNFPLYNR